MNILQYKKLEEIRKNFKKTGKLNDSDKWACSGSLVGEESLDEEILEIVLSNWNVFWKKVAPILVGKPGEPSDEFNKEWKICSRDNNVDIFWILGEKQDCFNGKIFNYEQLEKIPFGTDDISGYIIDVTDKNIQKKCPLFLKVMKELKLKAIDNDILLHLYDIANGTDQEINCNQDFIDGKVNVNIYFYYWTYDQTGVRSCYEELNREKFCEKLEEDSKRKYIYSKIEENQFDEYASKKRKFFTLNYGAQKEAFKLACYRGDVKHMKNIAHKPMVEQERLVFNKVFKQNQR